MDSQEERRRFQRLDLTAPVAASFDGADVELIEIGLVGALIRHAGPLEAGRSGHLRFAWEGNELTFECRVVRTEPPGEHAGEWFRSGLEVLAGIGVSSQRLRDLIAEHVGRVVAAQEANALGLRELNRIDPDHTLTALGSARRANESGFITWRLREAGWKRIPSLLPDQPADGFTVAAWEEEEQIARLRKAYEDADEEGRQFLRMLAELSISEATNIPPRKSE